MLYDTLLLVSAHGFSGAAEVREARAPARSANAEAIGRMVEDEEPEFRAAVISDAELDRLIAQIRSRKPKFDWSRKASTSL